MTPAICRAARAYLDWHQADLARLAGVGLSTVKGFEAGERRTTRAGVAAIERAFIRAGMTFWAVNSDSEPRIAMSGP